MCKNNFFPVVWSKELQLTKRKSIDFYFNTKQLLNFSEGNSSHKPTEKQSPLGEDHSL